MHRLPIHGVLAASVLAACGAEFADPPPLSLPKPDAVDGAFQWTLVAPPGIQGGLFASAPLGADDVWFLGRGLGHWDGAAMTRAPLPGFDDLSLAFVSYAAAAGGEIYACGDRLWHFDGHAWSDASATLGSQFYRCAVTSRGGHGLIFDGGSGHFYTFDGHGLVRSAEPAMAPQDIGYLAVRDDGGPLVVRVTYDTIWTQAPEGRVFGVRLTDSTPQGWGFEVLEAGLDGNYEPVGAALLPADLPVPPAGWPSGTPLPLMFVSGVASGGTAWFLLRASAAGQPTTTALVRWDGSVAEVLPDRFHGYEPYHLGRSGPNFFVTASSGAVFRGVSR